MGSLLCSSHVPVASSPHSPARPLLLDDRKPNAFTRNEASEVPSAGARTVSANAVEYPTTPISSPTSGAASAAVMY